MNDKEDIAVRAEGTQIRVIDFPSFCPYFDCNVVIPARQGMSAVANCEMEAPSA